MGEYTPLPADEGGPTTQKHNRRRTWRVYALLLSCLVLFLLAATPARELAKDAAHKLRTPSCNVSALNFTLLDDPSSWIVEASNDSSTRYYTVHPTQELQQAYPNCLEAAIFSARLVSPAEDIYYALPDPLQLTPRVYQFSFSDLIGLPSASYNVEILLEFGRLQGGMSGRICTDHLCNTTEVAQSSSDAFVGAQVFARDGSVPSVDLVQRASYKPDQLPECQENHYKHLHGYWHGNNYTPFDCRLMRLEAPADLTFPLDPKRPTWIHIIGDSNSKNLFTQSNDMLARLFPAKEYLWSRAVTGEDMRERPVFMTAPMATTQPDGQGLDPDLVDLVLTFTWWYASDKPDAWKSEADDLMRLVNSSLPDLFSYFNPNASISNFTQALSTSLYDRYKDVKQHRTLISFGSHSSELSVAGGQAVLDSVLGRLDDAGFLFSPEADRGIRFQKTTSVQTALIPSRFGAQSLARNSVLVNRRNELLEQDPRSKDRLIGFDTNALAFHPNRDNAVHFELFVYYEWARICLGEALSWLA